SNNATAVLFTPIAISTAQSLGVDPLPFVVAVILGANASFASPIGYQTNLLVMGPGHYRFKHYFIAGVPLILLVWITFSIVAPWYYGV
ncbi:SLC13 family permease, partial [uncultured Maritalea sp.]